MKSNYTDGQKWEPIAFYTLYQKQIQMQQSINMCIEVNQSKQL